MSQPPATPWIHIGECPVCVNGLCRVRTCRDASGKNHFYAICDECEATWIESDVDSKRSFPNAQDPVCPICGAELYGKQAHWSLPDELAHTEWAVHAIFDLSTTINLAQDQDDWLTTEDQVHEIDAPPTVPPDRNASEPSDILQPPILEGEAYGQDDPKPGC